MSYAHTYTHRVQPAYIEKGDGSEEKNAEEENDEGKKPAEEEKTAESDEAADILSDEEINDLVARSGEVTWDEFFSIFDGQVR